MLDLSLANRGTPSLKSHCSIPLRVETEDKSKTAILQKTSLATIVDHVTNLLRQSQKVSSRSSLNKLNKRSLKLHGLVHEGPNQHSVGF